MALICAGALAFSAFGVLGGAASATAVGGIPLPTAQVQIAGNVLPSLSQLASSRPTRLRR